MPRAPESSIILCVSFIFRMQDVSLCSGREICSPVGIFGTEKRENLSFRFRVDFLGLGLFLPQ